MSVELKVPALGESITEAVVGKWHKKPGQAVALDEPLVVLETDKVTIDVQAPSAGALASIAFEEGAKVKIGDVLGLIDERATPTIPSPRARGEGQGEGLAPAQQPPAVNAPPAPAQQPPAAFAPAPQPAAAPPPPRPAGPPPTPVARAVAADKGVDTSAIAGSGVGGRVMKDDVLRATAPAVAPAPPPAAPAPAARAPAAPLPASGGRVPGTREERVRMTPLRKRVAERLLQAQSNAAILTTFNEVDMGAVMALRKQYQERYEKKHGVKLGFMSFFVKAAVEALQTFPAVNAFLDGEDVVFHHYFDIGVAVSGSRGLVVPVVRDADQKSMAELEKEIADLAVRARTDKLKLEELQGGTFTITNGGIFGSMLSTPILNPPQTGILGMHNIVERPVAREGQVVIRPIMYLALSYDHRLIDGREAVQFLVRIKECIEAPERMLIDV